MHALLLTFTLLRGVDVGTTYGILSHSGSEVNPLLPQRPALNLTVGVGLTVGEIVATHQAAKTHPKLAKWMLIAGIAIEGFAVTNNLKELRK